jgi:hypothetical protein
MPAGIGFLPGASIKHLQVVIVTMLLMMDLIDNVPQIVLLRVHAVAAHWFQFNHQLRW